MDVIGLMTGFEKDSVSRLREATEVFHKLLSRKPKRGNSIGSMFTSSGYPSFEAAVEKLRTTNPYLSFQSASYLVKGSTKTTPGK